MLSKWVVSTYQGIVETALWVFLVAGALIGAGLGSVIGYGFLGFLIGGTVAFFGMAVFLGAALVLGDIRQAVRRIETKIQANQQTHLYSADQSGQITSDKEICPFCKEPSLKTNKMCEVCGRQKR